MRALSSCLTLTLAVATSARAATPTDWVLYELERRLSDGTVHERVVRVTERDGLQTFQVWFRGPPERPAVWPGGEVMAEVLKRVRASARPKLEQCARGEGARVPCQRYEWLESRSA